MFFHFLTQSLPKNRRMDGRADKASYRVTCPQLKTKQENSFHRFKPFHQARRRNILTTTMINLGYVHSVDRNAQQNSKSWRTDSVWWLRRGRGKDVAVISLVSKSWKLKNKFRSEEQRNVTCFGSFKQEVE